MAPPSMSGCFRLVVGWSLVYFPGSAEARLSWVNALHLGPVERIYSEAGWPLGAPTFSMHAVWGGCRGAALLFCVVFVSHAHTHIGASIHSHYWLLILIFCLLFINKFVNFVATSSPLPFLVTVLEPDCNIRKKRKSRGAIKCFQSTNVLINNVTDAIARQTIQFSQLQWLRPRMKNKEVKESLDGGWF